MGGVTQMAQERVRKDAKASKTKERSQDTSETPQKDSEALKAELDDLLNEVDEALGENLANAQEMVDGFVQKGGQ